MFSVFHRALLLVVTLVILRWFFPDLTEALVNLLVRLIELANSALSGELSPPDLTAYF